MPACWKAQSEFNTVKQCFDYIARLSGSLVAAEISKRIEEATNDYIDVNAGSSANLSNIFQKLGELYKSISSNYQSAHVPQSEPSGNECDGAYLYYLNICLHRLCCALSFLNFNTSATRGQSGGGGWSDSSCNASNSELCKWLIGQNEGPGIIKGGFSISDLSGTRGDKIAGEIGKHLNSNGDLYGFLLVALFIAPWLPEKTANACLLVKQLCDGISEDNMRGELTQHHSNAYDDIKRICAHLTAALSKLFKESGNGFLSVTYNGSSNVSPYKVKEQFSLFFAFLNEYLPDLIESLEHMKEQCVYWTAGNVKNATTPGPFLYGFNFTEKCNPSNNALEKHSELTGAIEAVLHDLNELNDILNPTSHAVAIGVGVVSSLLVGGSAATAYFYPGLLSSTINMVVG
ncbi:ribosome-binding protein 1 [Babesia caballi]|uniref:Ribosome-binding protein 1 n=1 Tax=Babesia caballi TaxID=5871 RepID=A0AAV4M0U6_BABCB|nr:ribosome-binding protein 1 [Babesia caballi]